MIVSRLICDGCGTDSGMSDPHREPIEKILPMYRWLVVAATVLSAAQHYCPTCRRAVEAADLRTALTAPRKEANSNV
jgi:hypothetical protein